MRYSAEGSHAGGDGRGQRPDADRLRLAPHRHHSSRYAGSPDVERKLAGVLEGHVNPMSLARVPWAPVEATRMLRIARRSALKARTQAIIQTRDLIVTLPGALKAQLAGLRAGALVDTCAHLRPHTPIDPVARAAKTALRTLARRNRALSVTTPGAFEAHGIWFPARELEVV